MLTDGVEPSCFKEPSSQACARLLTLTLRYWDNRAELVTEIGPRRSSAVCSTAYSHLTCRGGRAAYPDPVPRSGSVAPRYAAVLAVGWWEKRKLIGATRRPDCQWRLPRAKSLRARGDSPYAGIRTLVRSWRIPLVDPPCFRGANH